MADEGEKLSRSDKDYSTFRKFFQFEMVADEPLHSDPDVEKAMIAKEKKQGEERLENLLRNLTDEERDRMVGLVAPLVASAGHGYSKRGRERILNVQGVVTPAFIEDVWVKGTAKVVSVGENGTVDVELTPSRWEEQRTAGRKCLIVRWRVKMDKEVGESALEKYGKMFTFHGHMTPLRVQGR